MSRRAVIAAVVVLAVIAVVGYRLGQGAQQGGGSSAGTNSPAPSTTNSPAPSPINSPAPSTDPGAEATGASAGSSSDASKAASPTRPTGPSSPPVSQVAPTAEASTAPGSFKGCPDVSATAVGDDLDQAWLCGWLNREDPASTSWQQTIAPVTDPALLEVLGKNGDRALAITGLTSWRVVGIQPRPAKAVSTPTRHVATWFVTISDGTRSVGRTIDLLAYTDGSTWIMSQAKVGYTSQG